MEQRRCKKKLTPIELFAFRLCLALGVPHPDYLGVPREDYAGLTWTQFCQWQAYYNAEPWGEERADQRTQAQTMWIRSHLTFEPSSLPDMAFPYFAREEDLLSQMQVLDRTKKKYEEKLAQRRAAGTALAGD